MTLSTSLRRLAPIALCAAALGAATLAKADTEWTVIGTFDDGETLSGVFDINQYGQLSHFDLNSSIGPVIGPIEYKPDTDGMQTWAWPSKVEFEIGYTTTLHLEFTDSLGTANLPTPLGVLWRIADSLRRTLQLRLSRLYQQVDADHDDRLAPRYAIGGYGRIQEYQISTITGCDNNHPTLLQSSESWRTIPGKVDHGEYKRASQEVELQICFCVDTRQSSSNHNQRIAY